MYVKNNLRAVRLPLEGKLSAKLTDEVENRLHYCASRDTPHPSRLTPCHLPLKGKATHRRRCGAAEASGDANPDGNYSLSRLRRQLPQGGSHGMRAVVIRPYGADVRPGCGARSSGARIYILPHHNDSYRL